MTYNEAKKSIVDLAEKLSADGWDLVSIVVLMGAKGELYHECGEVIAEASATITNGVVSLLNKELV